jgi:hypothetical protein
MNLKWSKTLAVSCAAVMTFLIAIFYLSDDKTSIRYWVNTVAFPAVWLGARLFRGAPLTRTSEVLFNLYLIACTAAEGFVVGWCADLIRNGWSRRT